MNRKRRKQCTIRLLLVVFATLALQNTRAADITWTNAAGGDFSNPLNWEPNQVPGGDDSAIFNIATEEPYTVAWSVAVTNTSVKVQQGWLTWNLQGNKYTVTSSEYVLGVKNKTLNMTITNGLMDIATTPQRYVGINGNTRVRIVDTSGPIGSWIGLENGATLIVDGATLKLTRLNVSNAGTGGTLVITNNGSFNTGSGSTLYGKESVVRIVGSNSWTRMHGLSIDCGCRAEFIFPMVL